MTKQVASIYFMPVHAERPNYGGRFDMPAVAKGDKPFILVVPDHIQLEKQPHIIGGGQVPRTIFAEEIAPDIVGQWSSNGLGMNPDCGPGIWVVRDTIPVLKSDGMPEVDAFKRAVFRAASDEEKRAMWEEDHAKAISRQEKWGAYLIEQGDILDSDPEKKQRVWIRDTHRAAAKYYGRERAWLHELKDGDIKACPFCLKAIHPLVVKCPFCNEVVDRKRYEELTQGATQKTGVPPPLPPKPAQARA